MKLATYAYGTAITCGIVTEKGIIDIRSSCTGKVRPHSIKEILIRGDACLDMVRELEHTAQNVIDPADVRFLPPVPRPGKLVALAGNYTKHIIEGGAKLGLSDSPRTTTVPRPFLMPSTAAAATQTEIPWPKYSDEVDYEIELAVMIAKPAKCVCPEDALQYAAGYCIANDVSARSVTFRDNRTPRPWDEFFDWLNGKWSDGFLPLGPWLTTADEIPNPNSLDMELTVNGRVRQKASTSQMIFSVAEIISFVSHLMTLEPGDVIATGTPHGVGMATGEFLRPGDRIECRIEGLGMLVNTLGPKPEQLYRPLVVS
ncbi:MAG: fumarylacetoacetate hydrolase family protein [Phycisphaerae bacterium]|nr:fumarylacetoacetate hydrolase family protein [Phycisphaerae bacterium]